jgi:hypothetical protein
MLTFIETFIAIFMKYGYYYYYLQIQKDICPLSIWLLADFITGAELLQQVYHGSSTIMQQDVYVRKSG